LHEPDIIKTLKEEEKLGKLQSHHSDNEETIMTLEELEDNIATESYHLSKNEDINKELGINEKTLNHGLQVISDLMEIIDFTEKLSTRLHGDLQEEEILNIIINEFKKSNKYNGSILLLSEEGNSLEITGTTNYQGRLCEAERITGYTLKNFKIPLEKSHICSQIVFEKKIVQFRVSDLLNELFPKKLASTIGTLIKVNRSMHVGTPLICNDEVIGIFEMSSTMLSDFFVPSVKNLGIHISRAFEHAKNNIENIKNEAKLAESEKLYRGMIERIPLGIFSVNTKGIVTSCNNSFVKMAGYPEEELIGKNVVNFPTLRKKDMPRYLKMFKSIIKGNTPKPFEFQWVRKDGTICVGEMYISLIKSDEKITGIQAIIRDISKNKETINKLKEAEERYDSLFNNSPDLVYVCDFKGNFIDANEVALKQLGYSREEIKSLKFSLLLDTKQALKALKVVRDIKKNGYQNEIQEYKLRRKNGEFLYVESMGSLIYRDGKPYAVQGIARDTTERKLNEIKIKNKTEDLELLNSVNRAINNNKNLDEIFRLISEESGKIFQSLNAAIFLIPKDKKSLIMRQSGLANKDKHFLKKLAGIDVGNIKISLKQDNIYLETIKENKPRLFNENEEILKTIKDATENVILKKFAPIIAKKLKIKSTMMVPLTSDRESIGLIDISRETPFTETDLNRFDNIAKQLSVAIDRVILKIRKEQSEEKFIDLYERLRDGSATVTLKGKIIEFNSSFQEMLGYSEEEIYQLSYEDITPKKWHEIESKIIKEQVMTRGYSDLYEKEYIQKDGSIIPVELNTYLLQDNQRNPTGMWAIIRDITERKKAEKDLLESREHFRTLFNTMIDPVAIVDSKGKVLEITDKVGEITGFERSEMIGKNFLSLKIATKKTKAIMIKNLLKRMAGLYIPPYEIEILTKDGRKVPYEINAAKIDYMGKKVDMVVFRDISQRKKSEEMIKKSEEKFRSIFENVDDIIIKIDKFGKILEINKKVEKVLGYSRDDVIGKNFMTIGALKLRESHKVINMYRESIKTSKIIDNTNTGDNITELSLKHKNGPVIDFQISSTPLIEDDKFLGYLCVMRDVTKLNVAQKELRKAHEELKDLNKELEQKVKERTFQIQELLKQKDEFINQLGHDLKNPLNPLINLFPILEKDENNPERKEMFLVIKRNLDYMKNLVVKTIELARLNSPNTKFSFEEVNLSKIINLDIEKNKTLFDKNKIEIDNRIDGEIIVKADKLRIEELFDNLLINAVKYSPKGGLITIDAKENEDFVTVSVKDTGMGMNKEQLSHIFEEFYKIDQSRHDFDSSGLGLPICKRVVEKHGGRIWADSPGIGRGTTMKFTIPSGARK